MKTFSFTRKYVFELNSLTKTIYRCLVIEALCLDEARLKAYEKLINEGYMKNIYAFYQLDLISIDGVEQRPRRS